MSESTKTGIAGLLMRTGVVRSQNQAHILMLFFGVFCIGLAVVIAFRGVMQTDPGGPGDRPNVYEEPTGTWQDIYVP